MLDLGAMKLTVQRTIKWGVGVVLIVGLMAWGGAVSKEGAVDGVLVGLAWGAIAVGYAAFFLRKPLSK